MNEAEAQAKLIQLLQADGKRLAILHAVAELQLQDGFVAAGFLRNLAWDHCHGFLDGDQPARQLNDVDVIFFDADCRSKDPVLESAKAQENCLQHRLCHALPDIQWDVKNQARMHLRNHHSLYLNLSDAMSYWPEKETAVGVRLTPSNEFEFVAPFGLKRLFRHSISYNQKREKVLFNQRVQNKRWLEIWPKLQVQYN